MKFRKKPVIIEAVQWKGFNKSSVAIFLGYEPDIENSEMYIETLEDGKFGQVPPPPHVASVGDWIIKGIKGEFYPCKPDIFKETYEEIIEPDPKALYNV